MSLTVHFLVVTILKAFLRLAFVVLSLTCRKKKNNISGKMTVVLDMFLRPKNMFALLFGPKPVLGETNLLFTACD